MKTEDNISKTGLFIFRIGNQLLGVELCHVFRVSELLPLTRVPRAPEFLSGIICFEGEMFPVFDGRLKLGFEKAALSPTSSLLFLKFEIDQKAIAAAMIVDEVVRVIDLSDETEPDRKRSSEYVTGSFGHNNETILLLNVSRVFGSGEVCKIDITN